jgi:hypothetical protein
MKKTKNRINGGFVAIPFEMMDSKAFQELNGSSIKTLIFCMRKVKTYDPIDRFKFQFSFTYPEADKKKVGHSSFSRALKQLQALGFIDCIIKGGMRFQGKACSEYSLSQRWKDYGTSNFKPRHDGYCKAVHGTTL